MYPKHEPEIYIDNTVQIEAPEPCPGAYKLYGVAGENQKGAGKLGWFWPLYATRAEAITKDIEQGGEGSAHTHTFKGLNRTFYMSNQ